MTAHLIYRDRNGWMTSDAIGQAGSFTAARAEADRLAARYIASPTETWFRMTGDPIESKWQRA
jgi:hypothetical protein